MELRRAGVVSDAVRAALLDRLPATEFLVAFAHRSALVLDVVEDGAVVGVAVAVEGLETLSGAPVLVALVADRDDVGDVLADAVAPLVTAPGGLELMGPGTVARTATTRIAAAAGATTRRVMGQRLLVASELAAPSGVPGRCRPMAAVDQREIAAWLDAFAVEALGAPALRGVDHWLPQVAGLGASMRVWEHDGVLRAMVHGRRTTPVSSRIGPVYTPPEQRGRGYAGACTAAVTRAALADGDERVVLTTDVANPTSNALYLRLGFDDAGAHASWWVGHQDAG